jgi:hypothetical protein
LGGFRSLLAVPVLLLACGGPQLPAFRVGALPPEWRRVDARGDLTFRSPEGGTIYANVECELTDDAPLDVLVNHLLFGVDVKKERREEITLSGRKGLRARVDGELDGVPIQLDLVVMKKDGCTYDLGLIAGTERFRELENDFDSFVEGFDTVGRSEEKESLACSAVPC